MFSVESVDVEMDIPPVDLRAVVLVRAILIEEQVDQYASRVEEDCFYTILRCRSLF